MQKNWQKLITKNIWLKILLIFLVWRLFLFFISGYSTAKIHRPDHHNPVAAKSFLLQGGLQWDSKYYLEIAQNGYGEKDSALQVFFPLYPSLLRIAKTINISPVIAGTLINFLSGYFALYFLYLLALDFFKKDHSQSIRAILLFLFFPTAFFLSVFYTEALFCALGFGAFYFARKSRWLLANMFLAPLTALRLPGIIFAIAVFVEYLSQKKFSLKKIDKKILYFLIAPLGLIAYMIFLNKTYHDPLLFQHAYKFGWSHDFLSLNIFKTIYIQIAEFIKIIITKTDAFSSERLFDHGLFFGAWIFVLAIIIKTWKKLPVSYLFLCIASLTVFILKGNFVSVSRYVLPLFPIYLALAITLAKRQGAYQLVLAIFGGTMTVLLMLFSAGYWVG